MSEAYLFAICAAALPDEALAGVLRTAGAQHAWLSEAHWLGHPLPVGLPGKAFFGWPDAPLLPLFVVQSLARMLQTSASGLAVLGESSRGASLALLLGSPLAVGRWNLPPLARLTPLSVEGSEPAGFMAAAAARAAQSLPDDRAVGLVVARGLDDLALQPFFSQAACLPGEAGLGMVAQAARELRDRSANALLLDHALGGGLALLLERL